MKIITTPMCEDVLRIAGLTEYNVVMPNQIKDADLAILLSETYSEVPKLSVKLNTYTQIYESVKQICEKFNLTTDNEEINLIKMFIHDNSEKRENRKHVKVKVYSNFLKDTIIDMGFRVCKENYDYIVCPDYLEKDMGNKENVIVVPSHKNVSTNIIERITERYDLLERELCMKH